MLAEIQAAAQWIADTLYVPEASPFQAILSAALVDKFTGHWYPHAPEQGSAFRTLRRWSNDCDATLSRALSKSGISLQPRDAPAADWTLWIDPGCVSVNLLSHGGDSLVAATSGMQDSIAEYLGVQVIYGKLDGSQLPRQVSQRRPKTPAKASSSSESLDQETLNEFSQLIAAANSSPSKRSKAIAIVRPGSGSVQADAAATPARPPFGPQLAFTIQESTSPYVPSFAAGQASDSAPPSTSPTPTPPAASALTPEDSLTSDPFARPSSRASETSITSHESCSIFSHASNESRSSSIGSLATTASGAPYGQTKDVPKASPVEVSAVKQFTFPNGSNVPGLKPIDHARSCPTSPSKNRRGLKHQSTLSTSSAVSTTSSSGSSSLPTRPTHSRGRSSQSNIRVAKDTTRVQDYSNGKVGVLGGGVLLGLAGGSKKSSNSSSADKGNSIARPRSRSKSRSSSHNNGNVQYSGWYNPHAHLQYPMPSLGQQWTAAQSQQV